MGRIPRIMITTGEPAGIGPDIVLHIAEQAWPAELVVVTDPGLLKDRAEALQLDIQLSSFTAKAPPVPQAAGTLKILPVELKAPCQAGQLNPENATFVIACLELATEHCLEKFGDALVTGPVHKAILNEAGIGFSGHTEFLADFCEVPQTIMLFVLDQLKVALATTHLPLAAVPKAITQEGLVKTIRLLHQELQHYFQLSRPKILVSGLNPHAGENGTLGKEEIDIITPAIQQLRSEMMDIVGPLPADTLFIHKHLTQADAILAMYHDQALPVVKHMGFERAVNMTLGLPIIRTSVDHGTALDLAGTKKADPTNLKAALELAISLAMKHGPFHSPQKRGFV